MARHYRKSLFQALRKAGAMWVGRVVSCLVLIFVLTSTSAGQDLLHWREWRDPESPLSLGTGWLHIGSNGRLWLGQVKIGFVISWYDGYTTGSLSNFTRAWTVREGHAGQIWALDINFPIRFPHRDSLSSRCSGISIERYVYYHHPPTRTLFHYPLGESSPLHLPILPFTGVTNVIPATGDSLLILYPDRLIETEPAAGKTTILKQSEETNLGRFIHLAESQDGGLWITAEHGLAKISGFFTNGKENHSSPEWMGWPFPPSF